MTVSRLARAATVVALFGLVSRFLGLGREIVLAGAYGATGAVDAFVNALLLVNVVAAVVLYALVTVVIPVFQQERARAGERSAWTLVGALAAWVGLGLIGLTALVSLFPEVPAALYGLDPERARVTADLVRIMAPALLLQGASALFTALLQIHGRFGVPAAVGVAFNAGIIGGVIVGRGPLGIEAAAWGVTLGAVLQVVLQLPQFVRLLRGQGVPWGLRHPRLGATWLVALPVVGASVLQQVNNFTDKFFASTLEEGRVAALSYANSLGAAPRAALLVPFLTPLFPLVARLIAEGRGSEAARGVHRVAGLLGLAGVPAALLVAVYSRETAQLMLGRGQCDVECVREVSAPLTWYAVAVLGNFLSVFFNRALAAGNRQREVLWATAAAVAVTIVFDIILLGPMEQAGLALASAIGVYVNLAIYTAYLRRHLEGFSVRALVRQQARLLVCGGAAVAVALALNGLVPTGERVGWDLLGPLALKVGIALAVFAAAARVLAPAELREAATSVRALRRRPRPAT
ncbi:MAG TPA: lipid II flippase MurJ [Miltoncostaeaceae bacterium]|nr:lipid II flippase MurJ [Miltoncostaeaceae bacterium]